MPTHLSPSPATGVSSPGVVRGTGREATVVAFEDAMIGFFADASGILGVPRSVAILYGIVFASAQPLSFSDIEHRLSISKGSISQGLRFLREMGAIKEVSTPVDRVELFVPDMELRRLIERFLEHRLQKQLDAGKIRLTAIQYGLPAVANVEAETLRARLQQLQQWHAKAELLLPIARTLLRHTPG